MASHPLDPLTPEEIESSYEILTIEYDIGERVSVSRSNFRSLQPLRHTVRPCSSIMNCARSSVPSASSTSFLQPIDIQKTVFRCIPEVKKTKTQRVVIITMNVVVPLLDRARGRTQWVKRAFDRPYRFFHANDQSALYRLNIPSGETGNDNTTSIDPLRFAEYESLIVTLVKSELLTGFDRWKLTLRSDF